MDEIQQNSLASKLLRMLQSWINELIPEQTRNCIRSKVATIVSTNSDGTYNVILTEDYEEYLDLIARKEAQEITDIEYLSKLSFITIDNLFAIKDEDYRIDDYVIVGYLDNKLTNAFILCKNKR